MMFENVSAIRPNRLQCCFADFSTYSNISEFLPIFASTRVVSGERFGNRGCGDERSPLDFVAARRTRSIAGRAARTATRASAHYLATDPCSTASSTLPHHGGAGSSASVRLLHIPVSLDIPQHRPGRGSWILPVRPKLRHS